MIYSKCYLTWSHIETAVTLTDCTGFWIRIMCHLAWLLVFQT